VVSFGESLWSPDATGEVHEKVENSLRRGIDAYYRLGQLPAMPALMERPEITATPVTGTRRPLPVVGHLPGPAAGQAAFGCPRV
jgi:hypothetical protein